MLLTLQELIVHLANVKLGHRHVNNYNSSGLYLDKRLFLSGHIFPFGFKIGWQIIL